MTIHPSTLLPAAEAARWLNENIASDAMDALVQLCERVFSEAEAEEFVAGLERRPLSELANGLLPHDPSLTTSLRKRLLPDPELGAEFAARLLIRGHSLTADELARFDDATLARIVDDAIGRARPFPSAVESFLSSLAPARRHALRLTVPIAAELSKLLDDPESPSPALDKLLRARLTATLESGLDEERPQSIETVADQVGDLAPHLQRRALAVLRKLGAEKAKRQSVETTLPERARLALRAIASRAPRDVG